MDEEKVCIVFVGMIEGAGRLGNRKTRVKSRVSQMWRLCRS